MENYVVLNPPHWRTGAHDKKNRNNVTANKTIEPEDFQEPQQFPGLRGGRLRWALPCSWTQIGLCPRFPQFFSRHVNTA